MARTCSAHIAYDISVKHEHADSIFGWGNVSQTLNGTRWCESAHLNMRVENADDTVPPEAFAKGVAKLNTVIDDFDGNVDEASAQMAAAMQSLKGKNGKIIRTDDSLASFFESFDFFPNLISTLENSAAACFMDAKYAFRFGIKTQNIPTDTLSLLRRNSIDMTKTRGKLELYQLFPRLYRIQQLYGLVSGPPQKYRLVLHEVVNSRKVGHIAVAGNSGNELFQGLQDDLAKRDVSLDTYPEDKKRNFIVHVHGYQCREKDAFYTTATSRNLKNAVINALG